MCEDQSVEKLNGSGSANIRTTGSVTRCWKKSTRQGTRARARRKNHKQGVAVIADFGQTDFGQPEGPTDFGQTNNWPEFAFWWFGRLFGQTDRTPSARPPLLRERAAWVGLEPRPQFHKKDFQREQKERNWRWEREKSAKCPTLRAPPPFGPSPPRARPTRPVGPRRQKKNCGTCNVEFTTVGPPSLDGSAGSRDCSYSPCCHLDSSDNVPNL